jgi:hypothetical protein
VATGFKGFWQTLAPEARTKFAERIGTTPGYCHQIAFGNKRIELGLADVICRFSGLTLDMLPLTDRAKFQHSARSP